MYRLDELKRFAFPWLREQLDALAADDDSARIRALDVLASTCWRWTVPAIRALLPDPFPIVTEHILHAVYALDPKLGVEAAFELQAKGSFPSAGVARVFLSLLPPRLRGKYPAINRPPDFLFTSSPADRAIHALGDDDPVVRFAAAKALAGFSDKRALSTLFEKLYDRSPSVVRACLDTIAAIAPDRAVDAGIGALAGASTVACQQAAAESLMQLGDAGMRALTTELAREGDDQRKNKYPMARALFRWRTDEALDLFRQWAWGASTENRLVVANMVYEVASMELGFPDADSERRMERCRDMCVVLLKDTDVYVRSTALVDLAEISWEGWQKCAKQMLSDGSSVVRLEALGALEEKGVPTDVATVAGLLNDPDECVRRRAFLFLKRLLPDPTARIREIEAMLSSPAPGTRRDAADWLAEEGRPESYDLVRRLMRDRDPDVSCCAMDAALSLATDQRTWLHDVRRRCTSGAWQVRLKAIELLRSHGDETDLPRVTARFNDTDEDVRRAALHAAAALAPQREDEFALQLLTDADEDVARAAVVILEQNHPDERMAAIAFERLPRARGKSGGVLLELIQQKAPDRWMEAVDLALGSRSEAARERAAGVLAENATEADVDRLRKLLADRHDEVRLTAMRALVQVDPHQSKTIALDMLDDQDWRLRVNAIQALADEDDPILVDRLLPLARDEDEDVRRNAIQALARFDDARVFSELISSLNDGDASVVEASQEILSGEPDCLLSVSGWPDATGEPFWKRVRSKVDKINRWAARIGNELLGTQVAVQNYRQGLGRTHSDRKRRVVTIEVSDTPVTSGHPQGADVMRGLALHEIGHHLCDIGIRGHSTARGIARSEDLGDIYDILTDERLERVLRARRPQWGLYFDRLASYAFAQDRHHISLVDYAELVDRPVKETRQMMESGKLPGSLIPPPREGDVEQVKLRDSDMLAVPGLVPVQAAFLACLRCGFDPKMHPDPKVAAAVAAVPPGLKDLQHKDLLVIARRIGELIGTSRRFKREMKRFRQKLRQHWAAMRGLLKALDRMAESGQLADWDRRGATGIRQTPQIIYERPLVRGLGPLGARTLNLGRGTDFDLLREEQELTFNADAHAALVAGIRKHVRRLRRYLERLAAVRVEQFASHRGRRLDLAQVRHVPVSGKLGILVRSHEQAAANAYIGVLVDRSGSMDGEKIERAKTFCALLAESARGLGGIAGHVNAFDDAVFYRLGDFRQTKVASLYAGGGNNDAGALARAAELALQSGKRNKLLVMISDGSPTECTFDSLADLVRRLTKRHRIVCAQVAVESMEQIAFPHFVDLSQYSLDEAVSRFGGMIMRLTAEWR
jgi:HEAT repeat protein